MKKILSILTIMCVVLALSVGLTGCGSKDEPVVDTPVSSDVAVDKEIATDGITEITPEENEEETEKSDVEGSGDEEVTDEETEVEDPEATTDGEEVTDEDAEANTKEKDEEATEEEVTTGDDEEVAEETTDEVTVDSIVTAMKDAFGNTYLPNMPLDEEMFIGMTNISKDLFTEFYAEVPMMSAQVDKLFVVKAAEGKVAELAAAMEAYRTNAIENDRNYPINIPKLEKSVVETRGDYVIFYMLGGYTEEKVENADTLEPEELEKAETELNNAYYDKQNEIAKEVLDKLFK